MPPRSIVHQSKKEALLQLCNFLCCKSVSTIHDLADGEIFIKTIEAKFPLYFDEVNILKPSNVDLEKNENEYIPAKNDDDILLRFNYIQKFIDDHYKIKSNEIIAYTECKNISELELFKVAVFLLSEIIKTFLELNNEHLRTLCHLDIKYQVELEEIFKLFISERQKITKSEVENLLSKSAKKASPFVTPRRTPRNKNQESPSIPKEDVFINSPLKAYFESPVFKNEDLILKDKQIIHLQRNLSKIINENDEENKILVEKISEKEKELKEKEKDIRVLQMKVIEMTSELQDLVISFKAEKEKYDSEKSIWKATNQGLTEEVSELRHQLKELRKDNEKKNFEKVSKSLILPHKNSTTSPTEIELLQMELNILKDRAKSLELKNIAYEKQLSEKILLELKEKNSPGNCNKSYSEILNELQSHRLGEEENMARLIEEDNKKLSEKLKEANLKNKELCEKIENLTKKSTRKSLPNQLKEVSSVATMTDILNVPVLMDTSQTLETERLCKSLNDSKEEDCHMSNESYIFNNSDNLIPCEQSVFSAEAETPYIEKSSEAVLWKMYDSQKPEIESISNIHLKNHSEATENSHLDVINNLEVSNIKTGLTEPDGLPIQENKYVLGNLNFDCFLNELKKLTKNGSFQKVLNVFGKCEKQINGTNKSSRLDLQEMLKIITECVCIAVSSNTEPPVVSLQDKCCSTNESEFCTINQNIELDKLKKELSTASQKHEDELKEYQQKFEILVQEKNFLELKCQAYNQKISHLNKTVEDIVKKYREEKTKTEKLIRKCAALKETIGKLLNREEQQRSDHARIKREMFYLSKEKHKYEVNYKLLKEENKRLNVELGNLNKEKEKLLSEKEAKSVVSVQVDVPADIPNHLNIKPELHSSTFQDTANESLLSGAFQKSASLYISENEEDYFAFNSLNSIQKEREDDRVLELRRRNSLLPFNLQSSYPIESNLNTTYNDLYVKEDKKSIHISKKRKYESAILEEPSTSSTIETPMTKLNKKATPRSLKKFINCIKYKNSFPMKPK